MACDSQAASKAALSVLLLVRAAVRLLKCCSITVINGEFSIFVGSIKCQGSSMLGLFRLIPSGPFLPSNCKIVFMSGK